MPMPIRTKLERPTQTIKSTAWAGERCNFKMVGTPPLGSDPSASHVSKILSAEAALSKGLERPIVLPNKLRYAPIGAPTSVLYSGVVGGSDFGVSFRPQYDPQVRVAAGVCTNMPEPWIVDPGVGPTKISWKSGFCYGIRGRENVHYGFYQCAMLSMTFRTSDAPADWIVGEVPDSFAKARPGFPLGKYFSDDLSTGNGWYANQAADVLSGTAIMTDTPGVEVQYIPSLHPNGRNNPMAVNAAYSYGVDAFVSLVAYLKNAPSVRPNGSAPIPLELYCYYFFRTFFIDFTSLIVFGVATCAIRVHLNLETPKGHIEAKMYREPVLSNLWLLLEEKV